MFTRRIGASIVGAAVAAACSGSLAFAQVVEETTFEVTSVKPNQSAEAAIRVGTEGSRFRALNAPLILLIRLAYGVPDYRIVNTPDWARNERFDVIATTGGVVGREQQNAMLRTLLRERFNLPTNSLALVILGTVHPRRTAGW